MNEIQKIYEIYFSIIDSFFGSIKHYLGNKEDSHIDLGINMASYPLISDLILDAIYDLDAEIEEFWSKHAKIIFDFTKDQDTLKCIYSGDISPVVLENFVKKSALYVDTIIIADPILNLSIFQKQIILDKKYYLNKLIRHVFNIWKLKDLVVANTKENILIILPINLQLVNSKDRSQLLVIANKKFTKYVNSILNQSFESRKDSLSFLERLQTSKNIFEGIKNFELLPNVFREFSTFEKFLTNFGNTGKYSQFRDKSAGWNFGLYLQSQFIRVQEHKFFCEKVSAEPIYDYELPWFFFNYEIGGLDMDASIANALQKEKFEWISKIPISALKILREENKLDYMRNILRTGITDLKAKNDSNLSQVATQLEQNLKEAFKQQKSEIRLLEKEVANITKKEIPITTGGFLAGFIPYFGNIVSIVSAGRDIKKLIDKHKRAEQEIKFKEGNFINLLMKSYESK